MYVGLGLHEIWWLVTIEMNDTHCINHDHTNTLMSESCLFQRKPCFRNPDIRITPILPITKPILYIFYRVTYFNIQDTAYTSIGYKALTYTQLCWNPRGGQSRKMKQKGSSSSKAYLLSTLSIVFIFLSMHWDCLFFVNNHHPSLLIVVNQSIGKPATFPSF